MARKIARAAGKARTKRKPPEKKPALKTAKKAPAKTAAKKAGSKATISELSRKMDRLEGKIDLLRRDQEEAEDDMEESLETAEDIEEDVERLEDNMERMDTDLDRIEEKIVKLSRFSISRRHFMEFARGVAGAFIGVSVGMGLRWMPLFAEQLEWPNAIALLLFIFFLGGVLVYKSEKEWIMKEGRMTIFNRLMGLFVVSLIVVMVSLLIFDMVPESTEMLAKTLIVGSYPAMAGAITFSIR